MREKIINAASFCYGQFVCYERQVSKLKSVLHSSVPRNTRRKYSVPSSNPQCASCAMRDRRRYHVNALYRLPRRWASANARCKSSIGAYAVQAERYAWRKRIRASSSYSSLYLASRSAMNMEQKGWARQASPQSKKTYLSPLARTLPVCRSSGSHSIKSKQRI